MANRISKVVTRTGDDGSTGLADGSRIAKSDLRIETMGDIDELNSCLGLLQAQGIDVAISESLLEIQHRLFDIGGELALPGTTRIDSACVKQLEELIKHYNRELPPLREFILPGGNQSAALSHLARAVCRRSERHLFRLAESATVNPHSTIYINRLSDLLFILARIMARQDGGVEIHWHKDN
ncbi:MAG: ATP:Cob(I)alamin adenosyltransferase [Gammaproteobacteria bacterium]|nr:ATP:Cob(I)alamin adenosyltransferase [Gammaproteobacteria bacterium]